MRIGPRFVRTIDAVVDAAELAGREVALHLSNGGIVEKDVPDHQHATRVRGELAELLGVTHLGRDRLLDQDVLPDSSAPP